MPVPKTETLRGEFRGDVLLASPADGQKLPRFKITAYSGGPMRPTSSIKLEAPIVVDLAGLEISDRQTPVLLNHEVEALVGHVTNVDTATGSIVAEGVISGAGSAAAEVLAAHKNGFQWQASIGAEFAGLESVPAGRSVRVNGRNISGPVLIARRSRLREISFVSVGADADTAVAIAAKRKSNMAHENTQNDFGSLEPAQQFSGAPGAGSQNDPIASERARGREVARLAARYKVSGEIVEEAIESGWDMNKTELAFIKASTPKLPAAARGDGGGGVSRGGMYENFGATLSAAFSMKLGSNVEEDFDERTLYAAAELAKCPTMELARMAIEASGRTAPRDRVELIKAALSTTDLSTSLGNAANKSLYGAYRDAPATWRSIAAIKSTNDFKSNTGIRANVNGALEKVGPGGAIPHAKMNEDAFTYQVDTWAKMLSISRQQLINDDLGLFQDTSIALGRMAARSVADNFYSTLMSNVATFFTSGRANYLSGASSAFSIDSLSSALKLMKVQRDADGNDLDIVPAVLLVPPDLEDLAKQILTSENVQYLQDPTQQPAIAERKAGGNSLKNVVRVEVEPRLNNPVKYASTYSATRWFLFASPLDGAMVQAFLQGKDAPTVEYFGLEAHVTSLQVSWRAYLDHGAAMGDYRAAVCSKGSA